MIMQEVTVEEVGKQPPEDGKWLSLQKASNLTGLSMATLRRYIKRKKVKSRRLGNAVNSKLQVYVSLDMLQDDHESRVSTEGMEEILTPESHDLEEDDDSDNEFLDDDDTTVQTINWMKNRIEEKDDLIQQITEEKDKIIEELRNQLQAASFRNGYLEAQKENSDEKVRLLTEERETLKLITEQKLQEEESKIEEPVQKVIPEKQSSWGKFCGWFTGKPVN